MEPSTTSQKALNPQQQHEAYMKIPHVAAYTHMRDLCYRGDSHEFHRVIDNPLYHQDNIISTGFEAACKGACIDIVDFFLNHLDKYPVSKNKLTQTLSYPVGSALDSLPTEKMLEQKRKTLLFLDYFLSSKALKKVSPSFIKMKNHCLFMAFYHFDKDYVDIILSHHKRAPKEVLQSNNYDILKNLLKNWKLEALSYCVEKNWVDYYDPKIQKIIEEGFLPPNMKEHLDIVAQKNNLQNSINTTLINSKSHKI